MAMNIPKLGILRAQEEIVNQNELSLILNWNIQCEYNNSQNIEVSGLINIL